MNYTNTLDDQLPSGRRKLVSVIRAAGDVILIDDAVSTLSISRTEAAKLLSRWTRQGWLRRVGSGTYVPAPMDSLASEHVLEDPWVLVPALFAPCYIGGRTAAEHWDLTEQLFRDIVVMTVLPIRERNQVRHGAHITLRNIQEKNIFGTKTIWRGQSKILISDVHRTIIDMLNAPVLGGGIQHVEDCLSAYFKREDRDDRLLIEYGDRLGNGAVFKRLGFLAERNSNSSLLVDECRTRLTKGNAKLDPLLECPRLISKWRLWIPQSWVVGDAHD
jgi:predicted transcriptional regulator of viral defense system